MAQPSETEILKALFAAATGIPTGVANGVSGPESGQSAAAGLVDLWPAFLWQLAAATGAEGAALWVDQGGRRLYRWQIGEVLAPDPAALRAMRGGRVYARLDLPGTSGTAEDTPLRALKWTLPPEGQAVLILTRSGRDFRAVDGVQLGNLVPYLAQALAGWQALTRERARAALDQRIGQDLGAGWLLFSASGAVQDLSAEARTRLSTLAGLRLRMNGWLDFSDPDIAHDLQQAIMAAQAGTRSPKPVELSREPLIELVIHATTHLDEPMLLGHLRQVRLARSLPVIRIADFFGLSRSEARLAALLCDGFSLQDAGAELGWTIETTRSASKQIFARMAVKGQAGVIRRMHSSALWFG